MSFKPISKLSTTNVGKVGAVA